jgi:hypothetical protein
MRKKGKAMAAILFLGLMGLVVGGLALRDSRVVSSTIAIAAPAPVVYELLADLKAGWTQWSPLIAAGENAMALEYGVTTSGQGATVKWTGKVGNGSVTLTECLPLHRLSYQTTMALGGMIAAGTFDIRREDLRTVVTWRDELSVGLNPIWRWLALAMDSFRLNNVNEGLAALKQVSEATAR